MVSKEERVAERKQLRAQIKFEKREKKMNKREQKQMFKRMNRNSKENSFSKMENDISLFENDFVEPEIEETEIEKPPSHNILISNKGTLQFLENKKRLELLEKASEDKCPLQTNTNVICTNKNESGSICQRKS